MLRPLLFLLAALLIAPSASAKTPGDCRTPRDAADMLFYWQQPASQDIAKAVHCMARQGRTETELRELARRTKRLYDSRALFVDMDLLSDQNDWASERGEQVVPVHPGLPDVVLERAHDGRWLWTKASLDYIEAQDDDHGKLITRMADALPEGFHAQVFGVQIWQYLALVLLVTLGLVLRTIVKMMIVSRIKKLVEALGQKWASELAQITAAPLSTIVMAASLRVTYPLLLLPIQAGLVASVAVQMLMVLAVVWGLYRLVDLLAGRMAEKAAQTDTKLDDQLVPLVRKSLKVLVVIGGVLFILQNLDVDVGSLLTGLGIGGLAFALAAKETLANFFGSIMIFVDRPFQIGDWIVVKDAEGIVEEVGFRSTRIRTFYNSLISMPNAVFTDAKIDNYGQREYRRTNTTLNLTYDTTPEQMQAFCEGVRAIIRANPYTRKDYYEVHMSGFGAHSLDVMLYFFFKVPSWTDELRERHNVFLEIMRLARELKVGFAFPTQTLNVEYVHDIGKPRGIPMPDPPEKMATVVHAFGPRGEQARPAGPEIVKGGFVASSSPAGDDAE